MNVGFCSSFLRNEVFHDKICLFCWVFSSYVNKNMILIQVVNVSQLKKVTTTLFQKWKSLLSHFFLEREGGNQRQNYPCQGVSNETHSPENLTIYRSRFDSINIYIQVLTLLNTSLRSLSVQVKVLQKFLKVNH